MAAILSWRQRKPQPSAEELQRQAVVDHALRVVELHRGWDWHRGYRHGRSDGFWRGVVVGVVVGVGVSAFVAFVMIGAIG